MAATSTGINRGYLFGIGKPPCKDYVFATHPYSADPFANLLLKKIFAAADVLVSEFPNPAEAQDVSAKVAQLGARFGELVAGDAALAKEAAGMTENIARHFERSSAPLSRSDSALELLNREAMRQSKPVSPLFASENSGFEPVSIIMEEPGLLKMVMKIFAKPEALSLFSDASAFERGHYHDLSVLDRNTEKLFDRLSADLDVGKLLDTAVIQKFNDSCNRPDLAARIREFVQKENRHLFLISPQTLGRWPKDAFLLTPVRTPDKPAGYFWRLQNGQGKKGVLMGSMHYTVARMLDFSKEILALFDASRTLAIEIDDTRPEIAQRFEEEFGWEKRQRQELGKLSSEEQKALAQILAGSKTPEEGQQDLLLSALKDFVFRDKEEATGPKMVGMEESFMEKAHARQMPIADLETCEEHFSGEIANAYEPVVPHGLLEKMVRLATDEGALMAQYAESVMAGTAKGSDLNSWLDALEKPFSSMIIAMAEGDFEKLERAYEISQNDDEKAQMMVRNRNMAGRIAALVNEGTVPFCIAGAFHMAGSHGLPALLKEAGFEVERV